MKRPELSKAHHHELTVASVIHPDVVAERGYSSIEWTVNDKRGQETLAGIGIPSWARGGERGGGLLIPMYRATGERISFQYKPREAVRDPKRAGKYRKYASVRGQANRLDVHPRNRDRIADPTVPMWITEGVKKADAMTSAGACVVALTGVFNWRSSLGTLGDWEDVPLKGRPVIVCFDADARDNPNVARAMGRLGKWLVSKGAGPVHYVVVPAERGGKATKGADDYLAAGGTLEELFGAATNHPPPTESTGDAFTEARLAEVVADEALAEEFCWSAGFRWMRWTGQVWVSVPPEVVTEVVRRYVLRRFEAAVDELRRDPNKGTEAVNGWRGVLSAGRIKAVLGLAAGIVARDAEDFDQQPERLNTPSGVVDLITGAQHPHDPEYLFTKITKAAYRPGAAHPDWTTALTAIPEDIRDWARVRYGQAITGHAPPDDVVIIQQGGGENGKTTVNGAIAGALGDFHTQVPDQLLLGNPDNHPTELMTLHGARLAVVEETPEVRRLPAARLKKIAGTLEITGRLMRKDWVTFSATHTLMAATNYRPIIEEVDHGTWRRLLLWVFPYRFGADLPKDQNLRERVRLDPAVGEAVLAWLVRGAVEWYAAGKLAPAPARVIRDTQAWRREADQVHGYIEDRLIFDPTSNIPTRELLADLNDWLSALGHKPWSDKLLASRFGEHHEVMAHHVAKQVVRKGPGTSTRFGALATSEVYKAWVGVRFRRPDDLPPDEGDDQGERASVTDVTSAPYNPRVEVSLGVNGATSYNGYKRPSQDQVERSLRTWAAQAKPHPDPVVQCPGCRCWSVAPLDATTGLCRGWCPSTGAPLPMSDVLTGAPR